MKISNQKFMLRQLWKEFCIEKGIDITVADPKVWKRTFEDWCFYNEILEDQ